MGSSYPSNVVRRLLSVEAVLPSYVQNKSLANRVARRAALIAICVFTGTIYGLAFAILPAALYVWMAAPILMLALTVIWALPDFEQPPASVLTFFTFALMVSVAVWPNYLAIALPGLPWITVGRLICFPQLLMLCIALSTSSVFKKELSQSVNSIKWFWRLLVTFIVLQLITIPISQQPFSSINGVFTTFAMGTSGFFVAAWVFRTGGLAVKWINLLLAFSIILCVIGFMEAWKQQVLWADHIPSFLKIEGELIEKILASKTRDGAYRVTSIFAVSLSFAEFMAIVVPFTLYKIFKSRGVFGALLWMSIDLVQLMVIVSTQSRLGIVGWLIAHVLYVCVWAVRRWINIKTDIIGPAVSMIYTAGAALFFVGMFTIPAIKNRTIGGGSTGISDSGRDAQFDLFWPKLFNNPFGHGATTAGEVLGYFTPGGLLSVDSYFITIGLEYGIIGIFVYFGMFSAAAYTLIKLSFRERNDELDLVLPIGVSVVVFMFIRYVLSQTENNTLFFLILGMASALAYRCHQHDAESLAANPVIRA